MTSPSVVPVPRMVLRLFTAAFARLLEQDPAAAARLRPHAGKRVEVHVAGLAATLALGADGRFDLADDVEAPDLRLEVDAAAMLGERLRGRGPGLSAVRISGDADFAQAMSWLAANLRWDAEDDLARWVGDVAAHRLARGVRAAATEAARVGGQLERRLRQDLADAPGGLTGREAFEAAARRVAELRDAVARLDKRVAALRGRFGSEA